MKYLEDKTGSALLYRKAERSLQILVRQNINLKMMQNTFYATKNSKYLNLFLLSRERKEVILILIKKENIDYKQS
jgi:hypothetical protein